MEYSLCGVALRLVCVPSRRAGVSRLLENLFSLQSRPPGLDKGIEISIHESPEGEVSGEVVFDAPGLSAIRTAHGYHLRSFASFLSLDLNTGRAAGSLSTGFMDSPAEQQRGLFLFAFLLLFSRRGLYGLHAGGVIWDRCGFLLVGGSGSGKTTLTCALTRCGWKYLSDDSVLLKRSSLGVEALAFGRLFHCAPAMFRHFPELARGAHAPVSEKHLVDIGPVYPGRFRDRSRIHAVLFPEIIDAPSSCLIALDTKSTLVRLIGEGAGLLNNRDSMTAQLNVLGDLASSVRGFRLLHGEDVHRDPARISALLKRLEGDYIDALYSAA
jgi:hypothetical protein